jgi:hypothetical protein
VRPISEKESVFLLSKNSIKIQQRKEVEKFLSGALSSHLLTNLNPNKIRKAPKMETTIVSSNQDFKTTGGFENESLGLMACDIEDIEIVKIQQYQGMPAYLDKTESLYPVVIKTPEGYFLVDGQELLEEAWDGGKDSLKCFVYSMDEHNDAEIALFILEIRTKPQGGSARYAEIIRNVRTCKNKLEQSSDNLIRHSQGGRRRGQAFNDADKSGNIKMILIASTGRGRSSVGDYLAYSDFIDDKTLTLLAEGNSEESPKGNGDVAVADRGAAKSFFKNIHTKKRAAVMMLQVEKVDDQAITTTISAKVLAAFKEDNTGKKVTAFDDLVGEKVEKPPKKVKETEATKKELGEAAPAEAGGSLQTTAQGADGDKPEAAAVKDIEGSHDEIGKSTEIINAAPPQPVYIKQLEGQAYRLLEIAKSQHEPLQIAEYVESVIAALTEVLTEIRTIAEDSGFREAA